MIKTILKYNSVWTRAAGVISVASLIQEAMDFGVGAPLTRFFNYYKSFVNLVFGRLDEPISKLLIYIKQYFEIDIPFNLRWKYILVPMLLYFFSTSTAALSMKHLNISHRVPRSLFYALVGGCVAIISSIIAGIFPIDTANLKVVIVVSFGFVLFGITESFYHAIFVFSREDNRANKVLWFMLFIFAYPFVNALIASTVIIVSIYSSNYGYAIPSIIQLIIIIMLMSFRSIAVAFYGVIFERKNDMPWREQFNKYGAAIHGKIVVYVILTALFVLACGRGLERFSL